MLRRIADFTVAGNHDRDIVFNEPLIGTSAAARISRDWTRNVLSKENALWLANLPNKHVEPGEYIAVHGCYLNEHHVNGYVTQTMLEANLQAIAAHSQWPKLGFCAHTHVPMVAVLHSDGRISREGTSELATWPTNARAVLINPGSVGQPRDGDPRAAFALVDTSLRSVLVHRVETEIQRINQAQWLALSLSFWRAIERMLGASAPLAISCSTPPDALAKPAPSRASAVLEQLFASIGLNIEASLADTQAGFELRLRGSSLAPSIVPSPLWFAAVALPHLERALGLQLCVDDSARNGDEELSLRLSARLPAA